MCTLYMYSDYILNLAKKVSENVHFENNLSVAEEAPFYKKKHDKIKQKIKIW